MKHLIPIILLVSISLLLVQSQSNTCPVSNGWISEAQSEACIAQMRNEVIASQNQPDINAGMEYLKEQDRNTLRSISASKGFKRLLALKNLKTTR